VKIAARLHRGIALVAAASLVVSLLATVPAVLAAGSAQSTTSLGQWSVDPVPVGSTTQITVTVTGQLRHAHGRR
jgi:hypothetical protein